MEFDRVEYYKSLSKGDLNETYFLVREIIGIEMAIYMTLLFGFLTVAYVVAAKLNRFQAVSLVSLYSAYTFWLIFSVVDSTNMLADVTFAISGQDTYWTVIVNFGLLLVCWIVSLILFFQVRRRGT